jgi:hypothetical protein
MEIKKEIKNKVITYSIIGGITIISPHIGVGLFGGYLTLNNLKKHEKQIETFKNMGIPLLKMAMGSILTVGLTYTTLHSMIDNSINRTTIYESTEGNKVSESKQIGPKKFFYPIFYRYDLKRTTTSYWIKLKDKGSCYFPNQKTFIDKTLEGRLIINDPITKYVSLNSLNEDSLYQKNKVPTKSIIDNLKVQTGKECRNILISYLMDKPDDFFISKF